MELEKDVCICNQLGLHARAATKLAILVSQFKAEVTLSLGNKQASAASVLGLLMLESSKGKVITVKATGPDAKPAMDAICQLINNRFDENE